MKNYSLILCLLLMPVRGFAQDNWELKKNEEGITVYTRKLNVGKYKEIKVLCEFNATKAQLVKILQDVDHHSDWVYNTRGSRLLSRKGKDTVTYYSEAVLPWPVSNRDFVVQITFATDSANVLHVRAQSVKGLVPLKSGVVRVPYSFATWTVNPLPNNRIKIEYTFTTDPGGSIPAWLVNLTATAGPFNSFKNLKMLIEHKKIFLN